MYIWLGHIEFVPLRQWTVGWEYMEVGQVLKLLNPLELLLEGASLRLEGLDSWCWLPEDVNGFFVHSRTICK